MTKIDLPRLPRASLMYTQEQLEDYAREAVAAALSQRTEQALRGGLPVLEPVEGDVLPRLGSTVQIHLASQDEWVDHTVVGYYVWPNPNGAGYRVFVQVADAQGTLNARLLSDLKVGR